jgi:hypothetical protein
MARTSAPYDPRRNQTAPRSHSIRRRTRRRRGAKRFFCSPRCLSSGSGVRTTQVEVLGRWNWGC